MNRPTLYQKRHQINWHELILKLLIWLMLEIWLNLLGFDDLADCSEFIFEKNYIVFCCFI